MNSSPLYLMGGVRSSKSSKRRGIQDFLSKKRDLVKNGWYKSKFSTKVADSGNRGLRGLKRCTSP